MGAAAFLMVEYVGIPYTDIVKHALLPAMLSYIGLFYIVHLEALKMGMQPIIQPRAAHAGRDALLRLGLGLSGSIIVDRRAVLPVVGHQGAARRAPAGSSRSGVAALYLSACTRRRAAPTCRRTSTSTTPRRWTPGRRCAPGCTS